MFGTDWLGLFDLGDHPINLFCKNINDCSSSKNTASDELKKKILNAFSEILSDKLGLRTKTEACFQIKENAIQVFKPKRTVPFAAIKHVDEELDRLEKIGVIQKVEYAKWSAPTSCIKKKKKIKVCSNFFTGLNECVEMCHYPLRTPEDIFTKLNGGTIFSKLNIHKGLYKYDRFPFGLKVAPTIFQQVMDAVLADCEFTIPYLDDILIKSESRDQHVEQVKCVF
ncbi:uncharacterized protein K02A2.6-like [Octopus sinensis]|uniref:Uncharacterized protein K02A2.6-like n=1 Tax=Octopus sinensis TaxID=2607531 RepID=A0A6P7TQY0_9MOLL|nr:uncharacterized protein K02A2.6-like [Octopus sinensis]